MPTIEVRFEHLTVDVEAYVGNRALPKARDTDVMTAWFVFSFLLACAYHQQRTKGFQYHTKKMLHLQILCFS